MATVEQILLRLQAEQEVNPPGPPTVEGIPVITDDTVRPNVEESPSAKPSKKIGSAAVTGALALLLTFVASCLGYEVSAEAASSITLVLMSLVGYFVKNTPTE